MTMTQKAVATARRNLTYRIGGLLGRIAGEWREPDAWEREYLDRALAHLKARSYPEGERDIMWGEMEPARRAAQMVADLRVVHEPQTGTVAELRARLEKIMSEGIEVEHDGAHRPA